MFFVFECFEYVITHQSKRKIMHYFKNAWSDEEDKTFWLILLAAWLLVLMLLFPLKKLVLLIVLFLHRFLVHFSIVSPAIRRVVYEKLEFLRWAYTTRSLTVGMVNNYCRIAFVPTEYFHWMFLLRFKFFSSVFSLTHSFTDPFWSDEWRTRKSFCSQSSKMNFGMFEILRLLSLSSRKNLNFIQPWNELLNRFSFSFFLSRSFYFFQSHFFVLPISSYFSHTLRILESIRCVCFFVSPLRYFLWFFVMRAAKMFDRLDFSFILFLFDKTYRNFMTVEKFCR